MAIDGSVGFRTNRTLPDNRSDWFVSPGNLQVSSQNRFRPIVSFHLRVTEILLKVTKKKEVVSLDESIEPDVRKKCRIGLCLKNKEPDDFRLFAQQKRTLSYNDLPFSFLAFFSARFSFNDFAGSFFASFFASNPFDMTVIFRVINLIINTKVDRSNPVHNLFRLNQKYHFFEDVVPRWFVNI